jgi:lysozyme
MNATGVDASFWQGENINWQQFKDNNISFAFLRATSGVRVDATYARNYERAGVAGILRGAYHYLSPQSDAIEQARLFAATALDSELPLVADIEAEGLTEVPVRSFLSELETLTGKKPIIYTSAGRWQALLGTATPWASQYQLWVAHWTTRPDPILPSAWSSWVFWQFTNAGTLPGHSGNIDMNYFNGDELALREYAAAQTTPLPTDPALEQRLAAVEAQLAALQTRTTTLEAEVLRLSNLAKQVGALLNPGS